jgi:hypothetical protein
MSNQITENLSQKDILDLIMKNPNLKIKLELPETVVEAAQTSVTESTEKNNLTTLLNLLSKLSNAEKIVEDVLIKAISVNNIFELWDVNLENINLKCLDFFCKNFSQLNSDECVKKLNYKQIELFCKNENTEIKEDDIFSLVKKWIDLVAPSDDSFKKELLSHIRLPLISAKFLTEHIRLSGLFSLEELVEAYSHQSSPTFHTELKFQTRGLAEIFVGQNTAIFSDYRKILNEDVKTKSFRKSLINSLKKNNDKLKCIGSPVEDFKGIMTDKNFISMGLQNLRVESVVNDEWAIINQLQNIYDKTDSLNTNEAANILQTRYSFFVKSHVVFN